MVPAVNPDSIPVAIRDELVRIATRLFITKGFDRTTTRELSRALGRDGVKAGSTSMSVQKTT